MTIRRCADAANSDSLVIVYYADPRWFRANRYQLSSMGKHRWQFIRAALDDLATSLETLNQKLQVRFAYPEQDLPELLQAYQIDRLVTARQFGWDEIRTLQTVVEASPAVAVDTVDTTTLFAGAQLPFAAGDMPATYSRFRRKAEKLPIDTPLARARSGYRRRQQKSLATDQGLRCPAHFLTPSSAKTIPGRRVRRTHPCG